MSSEPAAGPAPVRVARDVEAAADDPVVTDVAARLVTELALARPVTLGGGRLLAIDGPGGSGKTTLAAAVAASTPATVVHMDDLYDGWGGLRHAKDQLATLLEPLAAGRPGHYRRYDWDRDAYAETVVVDPAPLLVLEGVASGAARFAPLVTVLVWVWVAPARRLERGLRRDGDALRAQWQDWMAAEDRWYARDRAAARADDVVDGTGRTDPVVRSTPGLD